METIATNVWQKSKLLIKGLLIGALVLVLLVPAYFVQNLIKEREERQKEAYTEVSSKWAGRQIITGPVLVLPYNETPQGSSNQATTIKKFAYILPDQLNIQSVVKPEKRYRGIYQVMLYSSDIKISGKFNGLPLEQLKIDRANVLWAEAYVCVALSDVRGLNEEIKLKWNDSTVTLTPSTVNNAEMHDAFAAPVTVSADKEISFSSDISINGSEQLLFTPLGKETTATLTSDWPDPSFTGGQLPDHRISDSGFVATWKNFAHTRNFPQAWKEDSYNLQSSSFGADLFIPVSGYQKTMRSVKYAILCILLTFAAFFIIETVNKKSVHPFQYALIGLGLILFYTLLLSFSEYTGFNIAYVIASIATVGLIGWFVKGILQSSRLTSVLSVILVLMYSYVFTILQLQDYSLLLGSIGLFLTLGVIMHFSKKIQW
ncbi:MAG: cell envelope integrity protein CreD [Bacteroidota bacterium]|nr:cell envelope integrity protein CreD [Bacteroidota bacterium]